MPEALAQAGIRHFLLHDDIGLAQQLQALFGYFPQQADGQTRTGKRLPRDDRFRQSQLAPERADFVLEQLAERLDELHAHALRQAADVVVALDHLARPLERDALDDVGIERALGEEPRLAVLLAIALHFLLEHRDELVADDLPLALRIGDAAQLLEETRARVDGAQREMEASRERLLHLGGLAFAQEPVVDEDALELRPDRLVEQERHHRAVHAAGQRADDALLAHPRPDAGGRVLDERAHAEGEADFALLEERLVELAAARGVGHLGVELDGVEPLLRVGHGAAGGVVAAADDAKPARRLRHLVAVAHPHVEVLALSHLAERPDGLQHFEARVAVLAVRGAIDGAAEELGHELQAVADAKDRNAEVEHGAVDERRAGLLDAEGASGKYDPARLEGADLLHGHRAGMDLAVDVQLANAAGDELRVLRTEIEDEDLLGVQVDQVRPSSAEGAL